MSARYGHFSLEEMRSAVEAASSKKQADSPKSPQLPENRRPIVE
jgi:hypothetical protein